MEPRRKPRKTKPTTRSGRKGERRFGVGLLSAGAAAIGLGAAVVALVLRRRDAPAVGHPAPDLAPGATVPPVTTSPSNAAPDAAEPAARAPEHFRPDPTATPTADEREALRPATGPAPGFAADRGSVVADPQDAA